MYEQYKARPELDPTGCLLVLGHLLRWSVKESLLSDWETKAANDVDTHDLKFNVIEDQRNRVERLLDPSWAFDCPICWGSQALICEMVREELDVGRVTLSRVICLECGLAIPEGTPFLADIVCQKQIEQKRKEIMREYGLL